MIKMQVTIKHLLTGYWAGGAAISNQGFEIPTCAPQTVAFPVVLIPCPEFDRLCHGKAYRIQSAQPGLDRADMWYYAADIDIPSVIYRDQSPNNQIGYVFDVVPINNAYAFRSLSNGHWIGRGCNRLITRPELTEDSYFSLYSF